MKSAGGFAIGLLLGLSLAGCLGGVVGYGLVKRAERSAKRGWNLIPVAVYARDVAAGELVTRELVSQTAIPEQFLTTSAVKPDSVSEIVNQRLQVPASGGEPALWWHFDTLDKKLSPQAAAACAAKFPQVSPIATVEQARRQVDAK